MIVKYPPFFRHLVVLSASLGFSAVSNLPAEESPATSSPSVVTVAQDAAGNWQLSRNGEPYVIRGAGGPDNYDLLAKLGGNSVRTWGIRQLEERDENGHNLLDRAHKEGLTVALGVWVKQPRHGFDYDDPVQIEEQREEIRQAVRRYKDHPALLVWGLGNEVEIQRPAEEYPHIFAEINELARIVKEEDPNHPVMTVIAGTAEAKIQAIIENYPEIDILGVNAYRAAPNVRERIRKAGWTKPYVLAEFGPAGPWETPQTSWNRPIEPTTLEKMESYETAYLENVEGAADQCLGTYAFIWGSKQETTSSWFGLLIPDTGEKTPAVDVLSQLWTGTWPENRSPIITEVNADFGKESIRPGMKSEIFVSVDYSGNGELRGDAWVMEEASKPKIGGDKEDVPNRIPGCLIQKSPTAWVFTAPEQPGEYRLFVKVTDGLGGGSFESLPFRVQ